MVNGIVNSGYLPNKYHLQLESFGSVFRDESEPEYIADSDAEKPEGWLDDEPDLVSDPDSEKPEDW